MAQRILIVDDEPDICEILKFNLESEGYEVATAEAPFDLCNAPILPDLLLLDVMMTPISGFEWAAQLKASPRTAHLPIIFCTAKATESDTLTGFALGSDDYIKKPFHISEVKARVKAVLKRTTSISVAQSSMQTYLGLKLNADSKHCIVDGNNVQLTYLEFELLWLLLCHAGNVFSREQILSRIWPDHTVVVDRTVDVNITRIRKKIGRYGNCIRTRFGYGYMFDKVLD